MSSDLSSGAIANMLRSWDHCWPAPWLEKTASDAADRLDTQAAEIERLKAELDDAKAFLDNAISSAPDPLVVLGEWLADMLDEDRWPTAERLLNAAVVAVQDITAEKDAAVSRSREASKYLAIETGHAEQAEAERDRLAAENWRMRQDGER